MYAFKIACVVPTYNNKNDLARLLDSLDMQSVHADLFIVDSSSHDGTAELAHSRCNNVHTVQSKDFNHGGTRQLLVDLNPGYDIYVFLTQDAYLEDPHAIEKLVSPFVDDEVGAVCGRQLSHLDATPLAQHARIYNYPSASKIKEMADASELGIKCAFMSNSFAAYRYKALKSVGGFPTHVIFAEDMYVAAKMLLSGWKIGYEGDACCRHSHNYSLVEEFRRYFDMGVFHAREPWIRKSFGGAGGEGFRYVKSELNYLKSHHSSWIPNSIVRNIIKLAAYKVSQFEKFMPLSLKKKLSMYRRYWDSPFANRY